MGRTRLTAGLSLDASDTPEAGNKEERGRIVNWGGRVGMTSSILGGDATLHGGVSRRSRFPSLRELYSGALGRFLPNPELGSEVIVAAEAGVTWRALQVVGFHHRLRNGILRVTVLTDEGRRFHRVNLRALRTTGLEVLVHGRLSLIEYSADLTLQRTRLRDPTASQSQVEYEPAVAGKGRASAPVPFSAVVSGELRFLSSQYCQNPDVVQWDRLDPSALADLDLSRSFGLDGWWRFSRLDAAVAVTNVSDALVFDQCGLPQPGRTFSLQLRIW